MFDDILVIEGDRLAILKWTMNNLNEIFSRADRCSQLHSSVLETAVKQLVLSRVILSDPTYVCSFVEIDAMQDSCDAIRVIRYLTFFCSRLCIRQCEYLFSISYPCLFTCLPKNSIFCFVCLSRAPPRSNSIAVCYAVKALFVTLGVCVCVCVFVLCVCCVCHIWRCNRPPITLFENRTVDKHRWNKGWRTKVRPLQQISVSSNFVRSLVRCVRNVLALLISRRECRFYRFRF